MMRSAAADFIVASFVFWLKDETIRPVSLIYRRSKSKKDASYRSAPQELFGAGEPGGALGTQSAAEGK